jgi:outer membrane receptor protein involved in Fe transport
MTQHFNQGARICLTVLLVVVCVFVSQALARAQTAPTEKRLEGFVFDQMRAPIAGAEVELTDGARLIAEAQTDADGQFVFSDLRVREGVLTIGARGFAREVRRWSANNAGTSKLEIILVPAPVTEQLTVTATRTEARIDETAASVSLLSGAQLETTAALRVDDTLRQIPGFSLFRRSGSRTANPTTQGVSLRGVGASGASRALVLMDGAPLNDPFGGWVYWGRVPRAALARIEVLRGGASHLYGGGALGGVVNLIPRKASTPSLSLEISYGNQRTPDATLFAGTSKGKWDANMSAEAFSTGGYVIVDKRERGFVDTPAGARSSSVDLTLERRVADNGRLFVRGELFGEARANGTPLQINRTHIRQLSVGADFQTKDFGSFTFRSYGGTEVFDQNFSAVSADRNSETLTRVQRVPAQTVGLMTQWSLAAGMRHTFVAGLEAREVRGASDEIVFAQNRTSSLVGAGGREQTVGLFLEDVLRVTPKLFLTAGGRIDRWREFMGRSTTRALRPLQPANTRAFPDRTETAFSPQLSLLYKPFEAVSLAASFTRAFRQPTLNELYRSFRVGDVLTVANESLRAERSTGGEAGASFYLFDRKLSARSTFFWTEITRPVANVTLQVTPSLITRQRQNLGRMRSRGLELEAEAQINQRWTVTGGYLLADATVLEFPANRTLEGLATPQVARHQFTAQVRYADASRFTFALQARAGGNQFDDDQNLFRLGSYFVLDAFASRRLKRGVELFAAAENVFNQRYTIGRTPVTTIGPPLLLRFGLRLRLGAQ